MHASNLVFRMQKQEDDKFKVSLDCASKSCLKKQTKSDTKIMGILVSNRQNESKRYKVKTTYSVPLSKVQA